MKSFAELEEKDSQLSVQLADLDGSGVLILDRDQSMLRLTTKKAFSPKADINGWFDIDLVSGTQSVVLLNALFRSQKGFGTSNTESEIFPNIVVIGAEALSGRRRVRSVVFGLNKIENFFSHRVIESHFLSGSRQQASKILKYARRVRLSQKYKVQSDFSRPDSVYIVHKTPKILSFDALGSRFEIHWGMRSSHGWGSITLRAEPFAHIRFSAPKSVDDAIDEIWIWKRLFCQLAMERLELTGVWARGVPRRRYADIYLPNTARDGKKRDFDAWAFRSGESPFSSWRDRHKLAEGMQSWLSKEKGRRTFRINVDRVIANLHERVSLEDVVTLCSAIESLDELKSDGGLSNGDIGIIADAAVAGASRAGIAIDPARIRGTLGLLKHRSLPQRLKGLMNAISTAVTQEDAKIIMDGTLGLRTIAAHGGSITSPSIPRVSPIVTALTGCCVLYDLLTSAFPARANDSSRVRAAQQISLALDSIALLERASRSQNS